MPDLSFFVTRAEAAPFAAVPQLLFKLRVVQSGGAINIHSVALRCQIRIEPAKRRHSPAEGERMLDLFGPPERWSQTLRPMLWTHTSATVPAFTESTVVDLPVPCTFDFNVAATKYFDALQDGDIPLSLLFSGTIFYEGETGLRVVQVPWEKEAHFRLPVAVWKEMMSHYYPNTAWLCLRRDVFDRMHAYKSQRGIPTWEAAFEHLLSGVEKGQPS